MNLSAFVTIPFVRILLFFVVGCLLYEVSEFHEALVLTIYGALLLLLFTLSRLPKRFGSIRMTVFKGALGLCIFCVTGFLMRGIVDEVNKENHLIHLLSKTNKLQIAETEKFYSGILLDVENKPNAKTQKLILEVGHVLLGSTTFHASGKVLLYINTVDSNNYVVGDVILVKGWPKLNNKSANPGAFDYHKFLKSQEIYHSHYISPDKAKILTNIKPSLLSRYAAQSRNYLDTKLNEYITDAGSYQVTTSMLLGKKEALSQSLRNAYTTSGAIHILAVSGLHVGIIYLLFDFLLSKILVGMVGRIIKPILLIGLLCFYAYLTGLSPSVSRASLMFSCMVMAKASRRRPSIFNTIAFSAFCILCIEPLLLFNAGFLLSYAAVTFIILLQPKIYNLFDIQNRVLDYIWIITSVSIAAQLGTLPITIYLFNMYPTYSLLTNLFIIPISSLILYSGITFFLTCSINWLGFLVGYVMNGIVFCTNYVIRFSESLPLSSISDLQIRFEHTILLYLLLCSAYAFTAFKKFHYFVFSFILLFGIIASSMWSEYEQNSRKEIIIYDLRMEFLMEINQGKHSQFLHKATAQNTNTKRKKGIQASIKERNILNYNMKVLSDSDSTLDVNDYVFSYFGKSFLLANRSLLKSKINFEKMNYVDYLLILEYLPDYYLDNLFANREIKQVVLSSDVSGKMVERLEKICTKKGLKLWSLRRDGCFREDI